MFEGRFKISMHVRTSASQDDAPVARWNSMCIFKGLQFIVSGENLEGIPRNGQKRW